MNMMNLPVIQKEQKRSRNSNEVPIDQFNNFLKIDKRILSFTYRIESHFVLD
jgi:hypothetical protein